MVPLTISQAIHLSLRTVSPLSSVPVPWVRWATVSYSMAETPPIRIWVPLLVAPSTPPSPYLSWRAPLCTTSRSHSHSTLRHSFWEEITQQEMVSRHYSWCIWYTLCMYTGIDQYTSVNVTLAVVGLLEWVAATAIMFAMAIAIVRGDRVILVGDCTSNTG